MEISSQMARLPTRGKYMGTLKVPLGSRDVGTSTLVLPNPPRTSVPWLRPKGDKIVRLALKVSHAL